MMEDKLYGGRSSDYVHASMGHPTLPVENYTKSWLRMVGDQITKTVKVDSTMLATT